MNIKQMRQIVRQIEAIYPAMSPISVTIKDIPDCDGYTQIIKRKGKERIQVTINSYEGGRGTLDTMKEAMQIETLIHELAHAIAWRPQRQEESLLTSDHNEEWGIAMAKIYRLLGED